MTKSITLTDKEIQEIYVSISCRLGFIETGGINRAVDLERIPSQKHQIKRLGVEQMKLVVELEELMQKLIN